MIDAARTDATRLKYWHVEAYDRSAAMTRVNVLRRRNRPLVEFAPKYRKGGLVAYAVRQHGTYGGYLGGCGCEPCRAANRDRSRERRQRLGRHGR